MSGTADRVRTGAWALLRAVRDARLTFLAAAIAYYAFVSLVPLLLVGFAVWTALFGEGAASFVVDVTGSALAPSGRELVRDAILNARGRTGVTLFGTALLLWSGLRLFRGLDAAFSQVYGVHGPKPLVRQVRDALTVLAAIGTAIAAAVVIGGVAPALDWLPGPLAALPLVAVLFAVFFPVYYVFPDVDTTPREVVPGALFAAMGWTVLTGGFAVYASSVGGFALYGLLGGALLLVTWLYIAGIIIILGGVLNAVLAGRTDDGDADADADAEESSERATGPAPDITALASEVASLEERLDEKTVSRSELEGDLRRYVRRRVRRNHARGWGPYLVLLYGTAMTLGAFYYLNGGWAVLAMIVVWLSTLGLYVLMLLVGVGIGAAGLPGRLLDWLRAWRS